MAVAGNGTMPLRLLRSLPALLAVLLGAAVPASGATEMEAVLKGGYESNVDRSPVSPRGDGFLSLLAGLYREPDGEGGFGWAGGLSVEGVGYGRYSELDFVEGTLSAGPVFEGEEDFRASLSPFAAYRTVRDDAQSALSFGAKLELRRRIAGPWYGGGGYAYTDSRARTDVYSYTEHVISAFTGVEPFPGIRAEAWGSWSKGESYVALRQAVPDNSATTATVGTAASSGGYGGYGGSGYGSGGYGSGAVWSDAFGAEVARERVETVQAGVAAIWEPSDAVFGALRYGWRRSNGSLGSFDAHTVSLEAGIRR